MHKLNWKPDLPDIRDWKYAVAHKCGLSLLPPSVDLHSKCSPIFNQDQLGSCTSMALSGMLEFLELNELQTKTASTEIFDSSFDTLSKLFIYYNERLMEGDVDQDGGAQIRDGIKSLTTYGDCKESTWCYNESLVFTKPSDIAYQEASAHKISSYYSLSTLDDMKHCLADGFPFVFGFTVYSSFESPEVAQSGILIMPTPNDCVEGGHAVLAVGYDDATQMILVRNSWGVDWGLQGYFKMPYQYVTNPDLASDFWTIRR